jgi:hypothetical protein
MPILEPHRLPAAVKMIRTGWSRLVFRRWRR